MGWWAGLGFGGRPQVWGRPDGRSSVAAMGATAGVGRALARRMGASTGRASKRMIERAIACLETGTTAHGQSEPGCRNFSC